MKGTFEWNKDSDYEVIEDLPSDLGEFVALDVETDGLNYSPLRTVPLSLQLSDRPGRGFIALGDNARKVTVQLMESGRKIITHGGKFEINVIGNWGIKFRPHHDTMLLCFVADPNSGGAGLKSMSVRYLGCEHPKWSADMVIGSPHFISYSVGDAELTIRLWEKLKHIATDRKNSYQIEMAIQIILAGMEKLGVLVDSEELNRLSALCGTYIETTRTNIFKDVGHQFELNSPAQVRKVLFDELGLPPSMVSEKTQAASTSEKALLSLEPRYPIVANILLYRRLVKRKSGYLEKLPGCCDTDGKIHSQFLQVVTPTGRLASSEPNMMNQPKKFKSKLEEALSVRKSIIASPGYYFIDADFSQIEFRLMIYSCGSPELRRRLEAGEDFHRTTAGVVLRNKSSESVTKVERDEAKVFNYGLAYGMDENGLAYRMGVDRSIARQIITRFKRAYPGLMEWIQSVQQKAEKTGMSETFLGPLRELPDVKSSNRRDKGKALRNAINDQIQGGAAALFKIGMIRLESGGNSSIRSLLPVHDSVLMEVEQSVPPLEAAKYVKERLEVNLGRIGKYPIEIKYGPNWGDMAEISGL